MLSIPTYRRFECKRIIIPLLLFWSFLFLPIEKSSAQCTSPLLNWTVTPTNLSCNNDNSGSISVSVTGTFPSYTYSLFGVVTGPVIIPNHPFNNYTFSNLPADNNYLLVVQVPLGGNIFAVCNTNVVLLEPPPLSINLQNQTNNICFGQSNGSIDIDVSGGTPAPPYTYSWTNGATTQDISSLPNGTYTVTVRDGNNCPTTSNYTINSPSVLTATASGTSPSCSGGTNGSIDLNVTGGTVPYTYLWNTGAVSEDISGLAAGNYSVTVTDINGCTQIANVTLTNPTALSLSSTTTSPSCFGSSNGSIDLTVNGGTAPYNYLWDTGSTNEDISGLAAGSYTVTVTDANGCTANRSITLTNPSSLNLSILQTNVTCFGGTNGSINLTVSGGTPGYIYVWSNGSVSEDLNALTAGNYTVTVTDLNSCTANATYTIVEPTAIQISGSITPVACFGGNTGAINVTVSGGTGSYTYTWSNGAITEDITTVGSGSYTLTVQDAALCTANYSGTISSPTTLIINSVPTPIACFGGNTGSIDVTVSGGTAPYSYLWNNGNTSQDLSNVVAGNYTVSITDASGCTGSTSALITQPSAALSVSSVTTATSCFGGTNGAINLTVSGGTAPYTFNWSNGSTSEDITGLNSGSYSLTITDAAGCTFSSSYTVSQPPALSINGVIIEVRCTGGSTGGIDATVSGGVAPYSYSWSTGSITEDITGLSAAAYTLTVVDANSCSTAQSFTVTEPTILTISGTITNTSCTGGNNGSINTTTLGGTAPYTYVWSTGATTSSISGLAVGSYTVTVTDSRLCTTTATYNVSAPSPIVLSHTSVNERCSNSSDGSINLSVSGGSLPYSFSWSNGATTEDINSLDAGTYTVLVSDAQGCSQNRAILISSPPALNVSLTPNHITCFGAGNGSISTTASGGTSPYTYLWSNGSTAEDPINLGPGSFSLTVTDNNGCIITSNTTITQPSAIVITRTITNVTCNGGNNGAINLTLSGGVGPFLYVWSNGATTEDISGLIAGNYTVTITDANGCSSNASYNVIEPSPLLIIASQTDADCSGGTNGSITITSVTGGTGPFNYAWSTGANTASISNLSIGSYSVVVTDANGCIQNGTYSVTTPTSMIVSASTTSPVCFSGNTGVINISISGGTAPFTYLWNTGATTEDLNAIPAGSYSVTVTDANLCATTENFNLTAPSALLLNAITTSILCNGGNNGAINTTVTGGTAPYAYAWSNGATTEDLTNLSVGSYTLTVTDVNACVNNRTFTITEPGILSSSGVITNSSCNGGSNGSINVSATGGTAPYTYLWSTGSTSEDLSSLAAGSYSVTISDNNTCTTTNSFTISEPNAFQITANIGNASCGGGNDGSVLITSVTGGTGPYSYLWTTGATTAGITNVTVGTYTVSVTDNAGCTNDSTFTVITPSTMLLTAVVSDISCAGGTNGAINLSVSGGNSPYTYSWSNGAITEDISTLSVGTYTVIVTDAALCSQSANFSVNSAAPILITLSPTSVLCNGQNNGSINATVTGGALPLTYSWSNGATTEDINGLIAGTYSLTVTDNGGCTNIQSVPVNEPGLLVTILSSTDASCNGVANGSATPSVSGGTAPYTYLWSNGNTASTQTTLAAGSYSVTVTDARGCNSSDFTTIANGPAITGSATASPAIICAASGATITASLDAAYTAGLTPYSFNNGLSFQTGATYTIPSVLSDSIVSVVVQDINGCTSLPIPVNLSTKKITATVNITNTPTCAGDTDGSIEVIVTGSSTGFTYSLDGGAFQNSPIFNSISGGSHAVIINDGTGCNASYSILLIEPPVLSIGIVSTTQISGCFGNTNGQIEVTVNGGTPSYTFIYTGGSIGTDSVFRNLSAGSYTVTVTDINGCTASVSTSLTQPAGIDAAAIVATINNVNCPGRDEGSIALSNVTGGTAPYSYALGSTSNTSGSFNNLIAGNYSITITDGNTCSIGYPFVITEPNPIIFTAIVTRPATCTDPDGIVEFISVSGGNPGYEYSMDDGATYFPTTIFNNLVAAPYEARVRDSRGCTASYTVTLPQKEGPIPFIRVNPPTCNGYSDGYIVVDSLRGGVGPFSYRLNNTNFGSSTVYFNISKGNYALQINDIECSYPIDSFYLYNRITGIYDTLSLDSIPVTEPAPITASTFSSLADRYYATAEAGLYNLQGGTPYYSWSRDNITFTRITRDTTLLTNFARGTHTLYLQDSLGCIGQVEVRVNVAFFIPNLISPNNDGQNDRFEIMGLPRGSFLRITNRWGDTVFRSENYDNSWDADELSDGVFYYELRLPNGDDHKGWVQVVR